MIRAANNGGGVTRTRILFAVGLVINFGGFVFDWAWHARNLSLTPIPPSKLLLIHSGIYVGAVIVAVAVIGAIMRRTFTTRTEQLGILVSAVGVFFGFLGIVTDMWAHGHGYEKELYHSFGYGGAALTVVGYLIIELFQLTRAPDDTDAETPTNPSTVSAGQSAER